jgi:dTDP-4-amino-4,6-dideoxygalactose transaminase
MNVPLLDLRAQHVLLREEINQALARIVETNQFILGAEVAELEREIAAYSNCEFAIGCASGSDALLLALMAYDIGAGDEVITTPYSFFATVSSITRLGATPVFVDIDPETYNLDVSQIEAKINEKTRAIMPVHLFGQCAEMDALIDIAKKHNIPLVEDAAQAIGSEDKGRRAGSIGEIGCFSFYPSKNLGGAGDGGMMTTNDEHLAHKLKVLRVHGSEVKYFHKYVGINSRLDGFQAAVLRVKLSHLDAWSEARKQNADRYRKLFTDAGLNEQIGLPVERENVRHIYNQFTIRLRAEKRDDLKAFLTENQIGNDIYYPVPLHLQECFAFLGYKQGDLPESERAARETLALPIYPELTAEQQEYVVEKIADFFKN